jgi:GR25 family glycosyltransferase involved in LPS biosynthesis
MGERFFMKHKNMFEESLKNVYLVSLKEFPDRVIHALDQCNSIGVIPIIYNSVYVTDQNKNSYKESLKFPNPGDYGCTLGHKAVLKMIRDAGHEYAMILEDDVVFCINFLERYKSCCESIEKIDLDFDLYFTYGRSRRVSVWGHIVPEDEKRQINILHKGKNVGTSCYIVTKESVNKILNTDLGVSSGTPIDRFYHRFTRACTKRLTSQERRKFHSIIAEDRSIKIKDRFYDSRVISVNGIRRSGNHIIIDWIKSGLSKEVKFFNNLKNQKIINDIKRIIGKNNKRQTSHIMISFEEQHSNLKDEQSPLNQMIDLFHHNILVLRDPLNLFASHIKRGFLNRTDESSFVFLNKVIDLWWYHFNYLRKDKRVYTIIYNKFVLDTNYRKKVALDLQLSPDDKVLDGVPYYGGGSSFDKKSFRGRGIEMDTLNRWQYMTDDPHFKIILNNKKLIKISKEFFGIRI